MPALDKRAPAMRTPCHDPSLAPWLHGAATDERSQPCSITRLLGAPHMRASLRSSGMSAPSSCLELDNALRPLLVQYPCAAVSTLDDVAGLEQHLRAAGAAGVGHPQVTHSGLACSRWRVHFLQIRCEDRSIDRTKLRRVGSTLKRISTPPAVLCMQRARNRGRVDYLHGDAFTAPSSRYREGRPG